MSVRVEFHYLAQRELDLQMKRYRAESIDTPGRFKAAIESGVQRILKNPDATPPLGRGLRYVRLRRFPHTLVFRQTAPDVYMIMAVAHPSRRPGYWRNRK